MNRQAPENDAARQAVTAACERLNEELDALIELMLGDDLQRPAEVYKIPYLTTKGADGPAHQADSPVTPAKLVDQEARWEAAAVIAAWRYLENQDARAVQRLPGVLAAGAGTLHQLEKVNAAKLELKRVLRRYQEGVSMELGALAVDQAGSKYTRLRQESSTARHLHVLQATRLLHVLARDTHLVSFFWSGSTIISTTRLVADVRADFEQAVQGGPPSVSRENPAEWEKRFRSYLNDIQGIPAHEELVSRRPAPAVPVARATPVLPGKDPFKISLPLFISEGAPWPDLLQLGFYDPAKASSRKPRSDRHVLETPVVEDLHLYRYRDEFRDKLHAKLEWRREEDQVLLKLSKGRWVKRTIEFPLGSLVMVIQDVLTGRTATAAKGVRMEPAGKEGIYLKIEIDGRTRRVPWSRRNAKALLGSLSPKR